MSFVFTVKLPQELFFSTFNGFLTREEDISLEIGKTIEIAHIDCVIKSISENDVFEIEFQTRIITKISTCLRHEIDYLSKTIWNLAEIVTCDEEKQEVDFFRKKMHVYIDILEQVKEQYKIETCSGFCDEDINLDEEHLSDSKKNVFCSNNCKTSFEWSQEPVY